MQLGMKDRAIVRLRMHMNGGRLTNKKDKDVCKNLASFKRKKTVYQFLVYNHSFLHRTSKFVEKTINTNKINTKLARKDS